jgi:allophanate hydrolase subunit 2
MAYRLDGPALPHAKGHDIVSDGIAMGAIQVPGDGMPLILMADRQPTGGYPKIGTVIRADLPRLAQTRPGQSLRLVPVTVETAVAALRGAVAEADAMIARSRIMRRVAGGGPAVPPLP